MIFECVEIVGFCGINCLLLMLEQNNVLIGENVWGKFSLLDVLILLLLLELDFYYFECDDFWFLLGDINGWEYYLYIILIFCELLLGWYWVCCYWLLEVCWMLCIDGYYCIFYCLEGESVEDGSVMILCSFFDKDGYLIDVEDIND